MDELVNDKTAASRAQAEASGAGVDSLPNAPALTTSDAATMSFLVQVVEELSSTLKLEEVLQKLAERVKPHVDYDAFGVLLLDPLGQDLRMHFGKGYPPEVVEHWRFGLGQGLVGTAAKTCQPVRVDDVRYDPRYLPCMSEIRSELVVPLVSKGCTIGVIDAQSRQAGYFTEHHQRLLTFLAGHLANAIENARLYENLREQARSLSLLNEVGRELTSILDLESLLRKVAELVKRIVDYQLFSVMLWNEETQLLEHSVCLKYGEGFCEKTGFPLGYGITGTAAAMRQPLRVPNVHLDPRYVTCGHEVEVRSELVVPLVAKDRLIGVLDVESVEYNAFSEQHEQMLSTLASYIAIAIENARLYDRVQQHKMQLADDLDTAREVQKGLLPEAAPGVAGLDVAFAYAPARQLGGDFYDFLPYGDGRLAIAVGDVAGKAAAAALQGSLAIGALREHVVAHPCEPAEMLEHMSRHLSQPRLDNRFVAMAFGVYDAHEGAFTVANAGFPRPCLLRGGRVEEIPVQGVPLGLLPEKRYEQRKLTLQGGDVIVFCSDGLHECVNRQGEEFGLRRLEALFVEHSQASAQEIADSLLRATDLYADRDGEHDDDRTVVVLKVTRP